MKKISYNYKVSDKSEIKIVVEHLYNKGYRDFNTHSIIEEIQFYMSRLCDYDFIYIIEEPFEAVHNQIGWNRRVYGNNIEEIDIQKILREKKLKRILDS